MIIRENCSLKAYNTFGIQANARFLVEFDSVEDLSQILTHPPFHVLPRQILGGGSNVLFLRDYPGVVLVNCIRGIRIEREDPDHVWIKAGAGETWNDLVNFTVDRGWGGLENLALIPGSVGAAPMQNIGAYGMEIKDVFEELEALEISTQKTSNFSAGQCAFGYRESYFKHAGKDRYVILSVTLRLAKKPVLNTSYGAIADELRKAGISSPGVRDVRDAVIRIRTSKLPDPKKLGNAGSFFKNPVVDLSLAEKLRKTYPGIVTYPVDDQRVKLAAGWLIEQCGWKGKSVGEAGVHEQQALVLVNRGTAKGEDLLRLSEQVQQSVLGKFGVLLEREVNII